MNCLLSMLYNSLLTCSLSFYNYLVTRFICDRAFTIANFTLLLNQWTSENFSFYLLTFFPSTLRNNLPENCETKVHQFSPIRMWKNYNNNARIRLELQGLAGGLISRWISIFTTNCLSTKIFFLPTNRMIFSTIIFLSTYSKLIW